MPVTPAMSAVCDIFSSNSSHYWMRKGTVRCERWCGKRVDYDPGRCCLSLFCIVGGTGAIDGRIDLLQGRGWIDGKDAAPGRVREAFQCTLIPAASTVVNGIDHDVGSLGFSNRGTYLGLTPEVASIGENHHRSSA